jgi:Bacterial PH domain
MDVFAIAPTAGRAVWFIFLVPGVILALVVGVMGAAVAGARTARFEVSPEGLRLRGDLYGRLIPADQLRARGARRIDFITSPELTPQRRTMGTSLPGYRAGWFRLRSGEKALLYLTDSSRAVYVPTTAGFSVLLSPSSPEQFLSALVAIGRN